MSTSSDVPDPINPERIRDALTAAEEFDAEITAVWQREFYAVEQSLIDEGYTCDQLAPEGRPCIACETSKRLRARLAPLMLGMVSDRLHPTQPGGQR